MDPDRYAEVLDRELEAVHDDGVRLAREHFKRDRELREQWSRLEVAEDDPEML